MDLYEYNRTAWNAEVKRGCEWSRPVDSAAVQAARNGDWGVVLTGRLPVPRDWFGDIAGKHILCLAASGGQQAPIFAAAGAHVTVIDISEAQLAQDRLVADREGLAITCLQGNMTDLSAFADQSFDMVFHPVSNCFIPDVNPVWRESFRVLKPMGELLAGFINPVHFVFDPFEGEKGNLVVRFKIPFSDVEDLTEDELRHFTDKQEPLTYGHSLNDLIGGQIKAGFSIIGFYENPYEGAPEEAYLDSYIATRAKKAAD